MQKFDYVIQAAVGLHARPAGMLVKEAKQWQSRITVTANGKQCEATKLMALMGLCVKSGATVTVEIDGEDEVACLAAMRSFFENNL